MVVEQQALENVFGGLDLPVHYSSDPYSGLVLTEFKHLLKEEVEGEHSVVARPEDLVVLRI